MSNDDMFRSELDLSGLRAIFGRNPAKLEKILHTFVQSVAADIAALNKAIADADIVAAKLLAHRMRGAALAVGAHAISKSSKVIEIAAGAENWTDIHREWPKLLAAAGTTRELIVGKIAI